MTNTITAVTQDNLPLRVSQEYAYRIHLVEELQRKSDESRVADVLVVSTEPMYPEIETAMGITARPQPYASFSAPNNFFDLRRNPFTTYSVGPSFGSLRERAECERTIATTQCNTAEDEAGKAILLSCVQMVDKINNMISNVSNNMLRFLQG